MKLSNEWKIGNSETRTEMQLSDSSRMFALMNIVSLIVQDYAEELRDLGLSEARVGGS